MLCPNVRVSCINAEFGCPLQMPRSFRAEHLQFCPASVVSCSMEWNRWPAQDAHSHPNTELHDNLVREKEQRGCLDLAMALKDQDRLFHSLKMKKLFPELTQSMRQEEEEEQKKKKQKQKEKKAALEKEAAAKQNAHTWESFDKYHFSARPIKTDSDDEDDYEEELQVEPERELTQEEREDIAFGSGVNPELLQNYSAWERMFSMEMGGCREAGEAAHGVAKEKGLCTLVEEDAESSGACVGAVGATAVNSSRQNTAPADASFLTPTKKKHFEYGHVEPMKIITVRTFKVPTSFAARPGRIRNPSFYRKESKAVDTSDLGVSLQDMPLWEEIQVRRTKYNIYYI